MSEAMSRRIRAAFNAVNFWQIVLYNVLALNSLDFAKLVAKRLLVKGNKEFGSLVDECELDKSVHFSPSTAWAHIL